MISTNDTIFKALICILFSENWVLYYLPTSLLLYNVRGTYVFSMLKTCSHMQKAEVFQFSWLLNVAFMMSSEACKMENSHSQ